jgi:phosphoribosylformylglycinamidine cyclo-ligase
VPERRNSYESAGVSIERGERAVELMRSAVEGTHGPEVIGSPGGFAGLYALAGLRDPVLASTIDGIGTKVLVAREMGRVETLGADIVNHCANDVLATGARPLFFLDYVGTGRLDPKAVAAMVRGAAEACRALGIAVIGGETAEMPGLYGERDFDVVGVCIGGLGAELDVGSWLEPSVFGLIRSLGNVPEDEMRRVFNLGVGFCTVVAPEDAERAVDTLEASGCEAWRIGTVTEGTGIRFA